MKRTAAIFFFLLCAAHAQARTLYVSLTGSHDTNAPAFKSWATAATNIQAAIDAASGGDTIRIAHGTYTIDAAATNTEMCYVNKPLSIIGGRGTLFDADKTILNANGNRRVMSFGNDSDPSVLRGVTLTGANTEHTAPGLYAERGMTMDSCIVRGNYSSNAGTGGEETAIIFRYNYPGQIKNCIVVGNSGPGGGFGGGITSWTGRKISVINSIVEANFPYSIRMHTGEILILNSICGNMSGVVTVSGGNVTNNTTNSVCRLLDIAPASDGIGTNLVWAGVAAYIPRLGSLARKNGQPYAGIETASDGAGGPALVMSRPFIGRDATTNLNHGAAIGGVASAADSPFAGERSAAFDGTVQYLLIGDANPLRLAGAMTIEAWIRTDAVVPPLAAHRIYNKCGPPGARGSAAMIMTNNIFRFDIATSASAVSTYTNTAGVPTNEWIHVAAAYSPSTSVILFTNGTISAAYTSGIPATQYNSNGVVAVLGTMLSATHNNGYKGNLSDVRIWNVARTPEQIAANYTNRLTGTEEGLVGYWPLTGTISPIDTGPFNLDNPTIHPTYLEAF